MHHQHYPTDTRQYLFHSSLQRVQSTAEIIDPTYRCKRKK